MAKIPAGVGPKLPQIVILFGATGDLSQRKLLPGLFHLSAAGFIPHLFIIGVSLEDYDTEAFRAIARQAIERHHNRQARDRGLAQVRGVPRLRADRGRRRRAEGRGRARRRRLSRASTSSSII